MDKIDVIYVIYLEELRATSKHGVSATVTCSGVQLLLAYNLEAKTLKHNKNARSKYLQTEV